MVKSLLLEHIVSKSTYRAIIIGNEGNGIFIHDIAEGPLCALHQYVIENHDDVTAVRVGLVDEVPDELSVWEAAEASMVEV